VSPVELAHKTMWLSLRKFEDYGIHEQGNVELDMFAQRLVTNLRW
jgi:hypothetical protein